MASGIAAEGAWGRLPILADALEEAGCDFTAALLHMRENTKTCWNPLSEKENFRWDEPVHVGFKFPNRTGGCWEGTCWVINWLLGEPQRLVGIADDHVLPAINPGDHRGNVYRVTPTSYYGGPAFLVEARHVYDAEQAYIDSVFGEDDRLSDDEIDDYMTYPGEWSESPQPPEYSCTFTDDNHAYDSELLCTRHVQHVVYFGPGLPHAGVASDIFANNRVTCSSCHADKFPRLHSTSHTYVCVACRHDEQEQSGQRGLAWRPRRG